MLTSEAEARPVHTLPGAPTGLSAAVNSASLYVDVERQPVDVRR